MSPISYKFLQIFNSAYSYVEVLFADQNSILLETEDKHNFSYQLMRNIKSVIFGGV